MTAADLPRIPATEPDKAPTTFRQARGFQLELVAAEPLVGDPVAACFDEWGRMFVAEMHGYPFSQEPTKLNPAGGGQKDAGIIRRLEDVDGDGRMDKSVVFADKISWPTSVCCYNGGVFVVAPGFLYYFKDTDGDGKADVREVVLSGFGRDNVQSVANGLIWGLDNKIYFAAGRNPKRLLHRGRPLFPTSGVDLRFDPKTEKFERVTGGLQYGHSIDDWGTRFVCSNSNHMQQVIYPQHYLARNPFLAVSGLIRSVAVDGASARVFRISPPEPWRIIRQKWRAAAKGYKLVFRDDGGWEFLPLDPSKKKGVVPTEYPVGFFTSATGITIYRGDAYPPEYRGNAFVGDVGGNLVHRKTVDSSGIVYRARRADEKTEFLRSTDNWFRPVNFVNAPDGTLLVLDMYRETVEHPYSIPAEIKKFLHLTSGNDRGRIYRLVSPGMRRIQRPALARLARDDLVEQLASDNGWTRMTAQRLLWQSQDKAATAVIEKLLASTSNPLGRLHALCTLGGLGTLAPEHVRRGFADKHPRVRAHAVRLAEPLLADHPRLVDDMLPLCNDASPHVRFQLAFTLGEADGKRAIEALARLARHPQHSTEIQTALLSSVGNRPHELAGRLLADSKFRATARGAGYLNQLGQIAGANPAPKPALNILSLATSSDLPLPVQQTVLAALGTGLRRRGADLTGLLGGKSADEEVAKRIADLFRRAEQTAGDEQQSIARRVAAIRLLGLADYKTATAHLPDLLSPLLPQPIQRAAVAALGRQRNDQVAEVLLSRWSGYSPQVRRDVVDLLLTRPARMLTLLTAVEKGAIKRRDIERDKKQLLLRHPHPEVRKRSQQLLAGEVNSNRARVVAQFKPALDLEGDKQRGLGLFKKHCATCHRVGQVGHAVAPEFSSVKNKSPGDLLIAILDPGREAQPNFNVYSVVTVQGTVHSGILAAETATSVTLRQAGGKEQVILRSQIEELTASGASLMPEGFEKELGPQGIADVIALIKSIK